MKKIFTSPMTYVILAVVGIIIYLSMKDGGFSLIQKTGTGTVTPPITTTS